MKTYILQNIRSEHGIVYVELRPERPGGSLRFQPGQYATIGFRGTNGHLSPMRCFSINSSPKSATLQFAARLGGDFTHALAERRVGEKIYVQGPFGEFIIDPTYDRHVVMIAGGIGITPFISMIRTATETTSSLPMTLLYSCRSGKSIPFYDELRAMEQKNPKLHVVVFATDQTNTPEVPRMLSGRMTEQHIAEVVGNSYAGSTYFICGPKGFSEDTQAMLRARGVTKSRIVTESFTQSSTVTLGGFSLSKATYGFASALLVLGIFSIAFLDLSRYVPKHTVSAESAQTVTSSTSTATGLTSTSTTSTPSSSTASTGTASTTQSSNYQQPVTSVS